MSGTAVLELTDPRWADFVARQPAATAFHHPDWATLIARSYGFRAFAVATSDTTGKIQAGLPMIEVRHLRREPKWVSLPFTDYCPPLLSAPEEEAALSSALQEASQAAGVRRVEVRAPLLDTAPVGTAFRHVVALDGDPDQVFARFRRTVRQQIRQAENNGLKVRQAAGPEDLLGTFYRLHLRTRRRIGVPDPAAPFLPHAVGFRHQHGAGDGVRRRSKRPARRGSGVPGVERDHDRQVQCLGR